MNIKAAFSKPSDVFKADWLRVAGHLSEPATNGSSPHPSIEPARPRTILGFGPSMAAALAVTFVVLLAACSAQSEQRKIEDYVALIEAAESGQPAKVEALLTRGTPVDATGPEGPGDAGSAWAPLAERPSPLFVAAANGHLGVVKALLKHEPWLDWRCCDSFTPLGTAAANGHQRIVELLLEAGADPSVATEGGKTPLEAARANGHATIVALLENAAGQSR